MEHELSVRRALSAIRLTQWADVEQLLRIRVVEQSAAQGLQSSNLGLVMGQGLELRAVIVLDGCEREAIVPVEGRSIADWGVNQADVLAAAVSNTKVAVSPGRNEASTTSTYRNWHLSFLAGPNLVATNIHRLLDLRDNGARTWWSVLSAEALVVLRPTGHPPESAGHEVEALVAGLALATENPFGRNLFVC